MTTIDRLTVTGKTGIKGQTFDLQLTGADLIVGPNGSGKSARLLALVGLLCGLTTTTTDTARPVVGTMPDATVTASVDSKPLSRDLSVTSRAKAWGEAQGAVDQVLGSRVVAFDLRDFEGETTKGRTAIVTGVLRAAGVLGWDVSRVRDRLGEHLAVEGLPALSDDTDTAEWVEDAIAAIADVYTVTNRAQRDAKSAADGLATRLEESDRPASTLATTEGDLSDARRRQRELEDAETRRAATAQAHAAHAEEGERLLGAVTRAKADQDQAGEAVAFSVANLSVLPKPDAAEGEALKAQLEQAGVTLAERTAERDAAVAALEAREGEIAARKKAQAEGEAVYASLTDLKAKADCCVHCDEKDPLDLQPRIDAALAQAEEAAEALDDLQFDLGPLRDAANAAKAAMAATEQEQRRLSEALGAARTSYGEALANRRQAEAKIEDGKAWLGRAQAAVAAAESDLAAWQAKETSPAPPAAVEQAEAEALAERIEALEAQRTAHLKHAKLVEEHATAIAAREAAVERFAAVKATKKALLELREAMARDAFGAIEKAAQPLLKGQGLRLIFKAADDFGAAVLEGWPYQADYVAFTDLSGAQRALVGAALSVAFATLSGAPWRGVVLDNMECITPGRLERFVEGLVAAREAGHIDQFLGAAATESAGDVSPHGCNVIDLGEGLGAKEAA